MTAQLAEFEAALKTLYMDELPEVGHEDPPVTFSILHKTTGFKGEDKKVPLRYGRSQSSHTFSDAQSLARASQYAKFLLTRGNDFHIVQMNGEALEAARDEGAVVDYLDEESRSGMDRMNHRLNRNIFRNQGMAVTRIVSGAATPTITVENASDLIGLDLGDVVVSSTDDGSVTPAAGLVGTDTTITAIDRTLGTVTTSGNWSANGFADTHYIFGKGDYGKGFFGAAAWFPLEAPVSGDNFFGLDRSKDSLRLAGQRFTAVSSDGDIERFLRRACTTYATQGGTGKLLILNNELWNKLAVQLGNKVRYGKVPARSTTGLVADVGFESIMIVGQHKSVEVVADRDCPENDGYILDPKCFWWEGLGEAPRYLAYDGMGGIGNDGAWLRMSNEDAIEGRIGARGQFVSNAPGRNARLSIPPGTVI